MKKIIHVINSLELGGSETSLFRLIRASRDNYQIYVIVLGNQGYYSQKIAEMNIPIYYLDIQKSPIKAYLKLLSHMKKIKPDVVQTWLYHSDLIGGMAAKFCRVKKIIWGIRCEGVGLKKNTRLIKYICARFSKLIPSAIITNSEKSIQNHIQAGYEAETIRLIHNGFDSKEIFPEKKKSRRYLHRHNLPDNAIVIGSLARFHKNKDYFNLIKAIKLVEDTNPHVYFILCGDGCHNKNEKLSQMLERLHNPERVILIDGVDDPVCYLNSIDIFIQPSKTEGFSNSLAEAMLCGLPCIATDVGETRNICGDAGLTTPSQNHQQLALACLTMLNKTEQERKTIGVLARQRIASNYSIEQYQNKIQAIYEEQII
ncbi:MAG: glycosyltransferase [Legionellaceae bacterium]|nr:glycosyltransferase [Legionellaceae bacterium]